MTIPIPLQRLMHAADLPLPQYASTHAAGADLVAAIEEDVALHPMQRALIFTGVKIALPEGYEAQVRPRSGLAIKHGITVVNAPGTIDADYRGEIGVCLINLGGEPYLIKRGDRIAQLIIAPVARAHFNEVSELSFSARGEGGFGSTGT